MTKMKKNKKRSIFKQLIHNNQQIKNPNAVPERKKKKKGRRRNTWHSQILQIASDAMQETKTKSTGIPLNGALTGLPH